MQVTLERPSWGHGAWLTLHKPPGKTPDRPDVKRLLSTVQGRHQEEIKLHLEKEGSPG